MEKNLKNYHLLFMLIWSLYLKKIDTGNNNPETSSTSKINKLAASAYFLFTCFSFDVSKHNFSCYRGKDCMKNFCKDPRKHAAKLID